MESEKQIENAILQFLNYQPGVFAFKINTMGVYDQKIGGYRRLSKWILPGTPDILACVDGRLLAIECKSAKGKQTAHQKIFESRLISKSNGLYFVVRSIQDAQDALRYIRTLEKA